MGKNLIKDVFNPDLKINLDDYSEYINKNIPELLKLKSIHLTNSHTLFSNTNEILKEINPVTNLSGEEKTKLRLAAILNKIGIPGYLKQNPEDKGFLNNHCKYSGIMAREIMQRLKIPYKIWSAASLIVERTYLPKNFKSMYARINSFNKLSLEINLKSLYYLAITDIKITPYENKDYLRERCENFKKYCTQRKIFGKQAECLISKKRIAELVDTDKDKTIRKLQNEVTYFQLKGIIKDEKQAVEWVKKCAVQNYPVLYITIGIAGCGKTTWINKNLPGISTVSMDKMRKQLLGDKLDQSENRYVFSYSFKNLVNLTAENKDVIWDATSCTIKSRDKIIRITRNMGAYVILIFFDVPLNEIKKRNRSRKEEVNEEVIERQHSQLEIPREYEADEIWILDKENITEKIITEYN